MLFRYLILFLAWVLADCVTASPALIGGKPASKDDFPASVYTRQNNARCSGTLVGPQTLLFAAHCVDNKASVQFTLNGKNYGGTCTHAPGYEKNETSDWALCFIKIPVTGIKFEHVNTDETFVSDGDIIELTGFGCTKTDGEGGNDGIYRIGSASVIATPEESSHDIITQGKTALCFGDSGGPAFKYIEGETSPHGQRFIVGVNSRGDIRQTSYLSSVASAEALDFFVTWSLANDTLICGIHEDAPNCRKVDYETPTQGQCMIKTILEFPQRYKRCILTPTPIKKGNKK